MASTTTTTTAGSPVAFLSGSLPTILTGWFVTYMVLLIAAESSPSLAPLAVAFAWLFAISVLYAAGPGMWSGLQAMIGAGSLTSGTTTTSGTGATGATKVGGTGGT